MTVLYIYVLFIPSPFRLYLILLQHLTSILESYPSQAKPSLFLDDVLFKSTELCVALTLKHTFFS